MITMTVAKNPFRPAFGIVPQVWAGRQAILDSYMAALDSFPGDQGRTLVISGLRGIGKTALVTELEEIASQAGWIPIRVHTTDRNPVETLVNSTIANKIHQIDPPASRRITGATIAGLGGITTEQTQTQHPQPTLNSRLRALSDLLAPHGTGIVISIDEVQHIDPEEMAIIATAYQDLIRDGVDISLVVAGLSHGVDSLLHHPGTTFIRRGVRVELQPLSHQESVDTLITTAEKSGIAFSQPAAEAAAAFAKGHPYLVQLTGSLAWGQAKRAGKDHIDALDVDAISHIAINSLGTQVHQPELKYLTRSETQFVEAMAAVMDDSSQAELSAIAQRLGKQVTSLSDVRARLLIKEVIAATAWGKLSFRLPYFKEYLESSQSNYPFKNFS